MVLLFILQIALTTAYIPQREANQAALTGAFAFNNLPEPQTISDCGADPVQIQIFDFVSEILVKADSISIGQILSLEKEVTAFVDSLPEQYKLCLQENEEVRQISSLYGITEETTEDEIRQKIMNYALTHFLASKRVIHQANLDWNNNQKYFEAGYELAELGKKALTTIE